MPTPPVIDLDAARREVQFPDGIPLVFREQEFMLPPELPADVLDPLLSDELDLAGIVKKAIEANETSEEGLGRVVLDVLLERPMLPKQLVAEIKNVFAVLFGEDEYARFVALRPSINDYLRLGQALVPLYGVGLGEASASPDSSESGGATSTPISKSGTDSTPAESGAAPAKKAS